jgi:O-antigen/teichoic acid export membrane protein
MKNKSIRASAWTIAAFGTSQLLRLLSNLILTRLLLPEMFGLMAIVTVVRVGVHMCSEIGLKVNIIRHDKGEEPSILNTAWTMQVIRGLILWFLIALIAWLLSVMTGENYIPSNSIYSDPRLPLLLIVTGSVAFITGFESTRIWLAQRNMMLGRLTFLNLFSQVIGLSVMVWMAWAYKTVWALVIGTIVSESIRTVLSHYVLVGSKNYFFWDKKTVFEFLHFGKWLLLSAVITFFAVNGDRVLLGGILTAEQLGFYTIAYFLATSLKDLVESLTSNVWFPLLSTTYREDKEKIVTVYYDIRFKLDLAIYFSVGFLYVIAPLIIQIMYDERYQSSGWMLQILSIALIGSCFRLGSSLLLSMGNPKVGTIAVALRALALIVIIPVAYNHFGLEGAIWGIAVNPLFEIPIILWFFTRYKMIRWHREIMFIPVIGVGYSAGALFLYILTS